MSMNERIYQIHQLLEERRSVSKAELLSRLEVSWSTLKRDLALMKDSMNAPIVFDRELGGYRFDRTAPTVGPTYELPGLWFSADEIHALLTMHQLLSNLDTGGLLGGHIKPLLSRLNALLGVANNPTDEVQRRIKIAMVGTRQVPLRNFQMIGSALLNRKQIQIDYYSRSNDQATQREISPQRLIFYRGNWYLDAWCHRRNDLRSFSIDCIRRVEILEKKARDIPDKKLDEILASGYGIFSGKKVKWATLVFSSEAARWVASEQWHPNQKGKYLDEGSYELRIPYSQDTELMMDILKYGASVKVVGPGELVKRISLEIYNMSMTYGNLTG